MQDYAHASFYGDFSAVYLMTIDATCVPFMLRVPGITDGGKCTKALVELLTFLLG